MKAFRTPDERFDGLPDYPFEPHYVDQDGLRMHYVDEGSGEPVLLFHGEPTWSFLYRKVIPPLARVARVVAPDYFGFGRSDKPVEGDWYSYDSHYASIERFVDELDLRDLTLVLHDWGGPLGLRLAAEQPDRVARLVITNTGLYAGRPPSELWLTFREFVRRLGTDLEPGRLVRLSCVNDVPDDVVAAYDAPHPTPESKIGLLMFPELVPVEPEHPAVAAMLRVREALGGWEKPTLVVFSDSDPIFTPRVAERLADFIPGAEVGEPIAGAAHFVAEDAGEELASRILAWLGT